MQPSDRPVVVPPGDQGPHRPREAGGHSHRQDGGHDVVDGIGLPRLKLFHQLRESQRRGQQETHPRRRHQGHVPCGGAVKGALRLLRRGPAAAQQKGRQRQRRHQSPQSQGRRRAGGEQLCDWVQGGGSRCLRQTSCPPGRFYQGQGGQKNIMLSD